MKLVKGNLWDSKDEVILVSGNSYIRKDGALVMGRGAALELKEKFPGIDIELGKEIRLVCRSQGDYGFVLVDFPKDSKTTYGVFQVKNHYKDDANIQLISCSCDVLMDWIRFSWEQGGQLIYSISMNFPGIGYGGLKREWVLPIISKLPDNVTIYEKE
jgi:hypothetical protein